VKYGILGADRTKAFSKDDFENAFCVLYVRNGMEDL